MKDTTEIARIIKKKLEGTLTSQEELVLDQWAASSPSNAQLLEDLTDENLVLDDVASWIELCAKDEGVTWGNRLADMTFARIAQDEEVQTPRIKRNSYRKYLPYAAAILLFSIFGVYYFNTTREEKNIVLIADLAPGKKQAQLRFADGQVISLSETQEGIVLGEDLTYEDGSIISESMEEKIAQLELRTPRGGRYQVTLSDGTKVWLNADSKLSYPSRFVGDKRMVQLEGEAYFEVSKSDKGQAFIVKTDRQEIEVLGTHFNVMSYKDEAYVKTTLAEGSVKVLSNGKSLMLSPGDQSVSDGHSLIKQKVELESYFAWIQNEFIFNETELRDALKMLSRWYDFETLYDKNIPLTHLYGTIDRSQSFAEVLKILETSGLKFRLEQLGGQNRLIVLNNQEKN